MAQHSLEQLQDIFSSLSRSEKALLLQWIARDLGDSFPGIESNPMVCGGEACVVRTRIPVWLIVQAKKLGMTEAEILNSYPSLRAEDLSNVWAYYRAHRSEIESDIELHLPPGTAHSPGINRPSR